MRSSIACSRCRRSKIKCVNAGVDTTCRACESSGRDCSYPTPAGALPTLKRDFASADDTGNGNIGNTNGSADWESPKRRKKQGTRDKVLEAFSPKVWEAVFELFQLNFATILPFLHPATALAQVRHLTSVNHASGSGGDGAVESPVLLGVLTLTARFHPQLAQQHHIISNTSASNSTTTATSTSTVANSSNPTVASEFYASLLRARLAGTDGADVTVTDLGRVQALLMLALHEWGMCRGKSAWIYLGIAIRVSQAMGLAFEAEEEAHHQSQYINPPQQSRRPSMHETIGDQVSSDELIEQETRRRTFWSCFILDRCLSNGRFRPRMLMVRDIGIQLPSENAFAFGERVRTSLLSEGQSARNGASRRSQSFDSRATTNTTGATATSGVQIPSLRQSIGYTEETKLRNGERIDRWEVGVEECVLGRLVRIIRIWGSVASWACESSRRVDQWPPWHHESRFSQLRDRLLEFQDGLYRNLQYSPRNTDTHIMYKNTLAPYALMHIVYFLSVIVLHRTHLPFLPLRPMEPRGPLDEPAYPSERYSVPDGFWKDSARELFRAARQMLELIRTCRERSMLMETPLVAFAVYNGAFLGVYAAHFNHMDQDSHLCMKPTNSNERSSVSASPGRTGTSVSGTVTGAGTGAGSGTGTGAGSLHQGQGQGDVRKAIEILAEMRPRLKMAVGWFRTIHRLHGYYCKVKREQRPGHGLQPHQYHNRQPSSSQMVAGCLYDDIKQLDRTLMELGSTDDQTPELAGSDDDVAAMVLTANPVEQHSETVNVVKSEPGDADGHAVNGGPQQQQQQQQQREPWMPVNSGNGHPHPLAPMTTGKENGEKAVDCERWPVLPALHQHQHQHQHHPSTNAPSYSLPPFQSTYRDTPSSVLPTSPPSSAGTTLPPPVPSSTAAPLTATTTAASSPYFAPTPSPSNSNSNTHRLQTVQPWPTAVSRQQPAPPPYSQSLPSLNLTAQQSFPLPPLQSSLSHCGQTHAHEHATATSQSRLDLGSFLAPPTSQQHHHHQQQQQQHQNQHQQQSQQNHQTQYQHQHQHPSRSRHVSPYTSNDSSANPLWNSSLAGEDITIFIEADSLDKWSTITPSVNGPPSPASLSNANGHCANACTAAANGWLGLIWS